MGEESYEFINNVWNFCLAKRTETAIVIQFKETHLDRLERNIVFRATSEIKISTLKWDHRFDINRILRGQAATSWTIDKVFAALDESKHFCCDYIVLICNDHLPFADGLLKIAPVWAIGDTFQHVL